MEKYIFTEIFTLFPKELYSAHAGETALKSEFQPGNGYIYKEYLYKKGNVVVSYAVPQTVLPKNAEELPPFVARLLMEADAITSYNKVILHYNGSRNIAHIIICTGEELKLANSFKADSFESALYFLFLSIQKLQMNPKQCVIRVCSDISLEQEETVKRFFNGVEKNNLDNCILK